MINLKEYIKEGLFDDIDKLEGKNGLESNTKLLKKEIIDWIINNSIINIFKNKFKFNFNTAPVTVDYDGSIYISKKATSLTNNNFQWGYISKDFNCIGCASLTSLKGAPKKVGRDFSCAYCTSLESLEGAPKEVGGWFSCVRCNSLTSLKGAPEKVGGNFDCSYCKSLKSLEGSPKNIKGYFDCSYCKSLKTLKGAPNDVGEWFGCTDCGEQFTEDYVKIVSNVKEKIYC